MHSTVLTYGVPKLGVEWISEHSSICTYQGTLWLDRFGLYLLENSIRRKAHHRRLCLPCSLYIRNILETKVKIDLLGWRKVLFSIIIILEILTLLCWVFNCCCLFIGFLSVEDLFSAFFFFYYSLFEFLCMICLK